jgi:5-methylcytosine-specific restriction endonuclease McrA
MKSRRHAPLPPGWYRTRLRILKRDGYRCTHIREDSTGGRCPEKATDVDHIDPNGGEADSNLRALCGYHHRIKSSSEGGRRVHQSKVVKKHPGQM